MAFLSLINFFNQNLRHITTVFLVVSCFLFPLENIAQKVFEYKAHDLIQVSNGLNIEILRCELLNDQDQCDVIIYTTKRQAGKRLWMRCDMLQSLRDIPASKHNERVADSIKERFENYTNELAAIKKNKALIASSQLPKKELQKDSVSKPAAVNIPPKTKEAEELPVEKNNEVKNKVQPANKDTTTIIKLVVEEVKKSLEPSNNTLTLDQCYQLALSNNLALKRAENAIRSIEIDKNTAVNSLLPSVSYDLGHYFSFGKNIDPVTNTFSYETFSGGFTSLGAQLNIFSGFRLVNSIKQSSFLLKASQYEKKRAELELFSNITLLYAKILLNNEEIGIRRNSIINTTQEIEIVNEKINAGRLTVYEYYTFNARLNTQKAELVSLLNDSINSMQSLKQLLNIPFGKNLIIAPVDTTVLTNIYNTNISIQTLDNLLASHPSIKKEEMNTEAAKLAEKIAKSYVLPSLSIRGNVSTNYNMDQVYNNGTKIPLQRQLNDNLGENINISLRIPIFSQMQISNRVKKES